jgi:hypothetical protein
MFELIAFVSGCLLTAACFAGICRQAGYSPYFAVLMLIPIVNGIALIVFAIREWPMSQELARRRLFDGEATDDDVLSVLNQASDLERRFQRANAANLYQLIVNKAQSDSLKRDADTCLRLLRESTGSAGTEQERVRQPMAAALPGIAPPDRE